MAGDHPMRRLPFGPIVAGGAVNNFIGIAPPPGGTGVAPCACADLSVAWSGGGTDAAYIVGDEGSLVFAASGTICPDTDWEFDLTWSPEDSGAAPEIVQVGASAWRVDATAAGLLSIAGAAVCGGARFTLEELTASILTETYSGGGGGSGSWIDITTLPVTFTPIDDDGLGAVRIQQSGSSFTDLGTGLRQVAASVEYPAASRGLQVGGLVAAAGAVYARLRIRIDSFENGSVYDGYACGVSIAPESTVTSYEEIVGPFALADLVIAAGAVASGDDTGTFSFSVDVEVVVA